jgi:hypothetical protein
MSACCMALLTVLCHTQNETSSDIFALIRKNCRRFEKEQNKTSLENRQRAVAKLTDMEHPVADGAFVLRDSTSQPGCFGRRCSLHVCLLPQALSSRVRV